jgi:S1-C subfamily serine protease
MLDIFKKTILIVFISLIPSKLFAENKFCLDTEGFIYPIFDNENCDEKSDETINEKEFSYIIDLDDKSRIAKLNEYRANPKNIEKKIQAEKLKLIPSIKDKNNLSDEEKKNIKLEQKKLAQKSKQKIYKDQNDNKKQKKLIKIKKQREEQKLKKEKKLAKIKKQKEEQKLKKEKKLVVKKADVINDVLKIVYLDKVLVNKELLPTISNIEIDNLDFSKISDFDKVSFKNLLSANSNIMIIIPEDFDSSSNIIFENQRTSQLVAGQRSVPNPEFNKLQMDMRNTENRMNIARQRANRAQQMASNPNNYSHLDYFTAVIAQAGDLAVQIKNQNLASNLNNKLDSLINSYSNTPQYLDKDIMQNYNFLVQDVKAEKKSIFKILEYKNDLYKEKRITISENKDFKIAYNINPQDKNYESLTNQFSTSDEVSNWQNLKLADISSKKVLDIIKNETSFKELNNEKELYASLNFEIDEESSWFGSLFNFGKSEKKTKKTASLSNAGSSKYEIQDTRFDSVVIVMTEKGLGSGFFISNDEILTNYHVIEGASTITVINNNKKKSSAVVIKKDLKRDLALLKTNMTGTPVIFFNDQLKQGEMVEALGHPKGRKFSLTKGWISAIRKESSTYSATGKNDVLFIQTDAAINNGNSGGPLFYKDKVVGVNTQGLHKDSTEGMNFAVHFSEVNSFLSK